MPKMLKRTIQGFRFEWQGGMYIEVTRVGEPYCFEVLNVERPDGELPDFTKAEFMREITEFRESITRDFPQKGGWLAELRHRARETYGA
jgi:hypothetical protein